MNDTYSTTGVVEKFTLPTGYDAYNSTPAFNYNGKQVLAARVEPIHNEHDSRVMFFYKTRKQTWKIHRNLPNFQLQDPFITKIGGEYVLGGVEIISVSPAKDWSEYRTVLYKGKELESLNSFYQGPILMKGLRLVELKNGKIALFTRPQVPSQKDMHGRGRIAFSLIKSLDEISAGIENAQIIDGLFSDLEWGGANDVYELEDGNIGVLGHKAFFDENNNRHYYTIAFEINPDTSKLVGYKTVVKRESFPESVKTKRHDLFNVLYTGGISRMVRENYYELFVGISDSAVGSIEIESPFSCVPRLNLQSV